MMPDNLFFGLKEFFGRLLGKVSMRQRLTISGLIILLIGWCGFVSTIYAAPGALDASFSQDGKLVETIGTPISVSDWIVEVITQPDGKIIALGGGYSNGNFGIIARYNTNGSLDSSFGSGGRIFFPFRYIPEIDLQADGKIIIVGATDNTPADPKDMFIARFNSDGSTDTTFGGDGQVTTDFGGDELAYSVAVQPDGKIVAAGSSIASAPADIVLARYNQDSSLDTSFGSGGKLTTGVLGVFDYAYDLIIQPDGKIVAVGFGYNGSDSDIALVRYNSNGSLDASYGIGGKAAFDVAGGATDTIYCLAFDSIGRAVVGGNSGEFFAAARVLGDSASAGTPFDFDGDGKADLSVFRPSAGNWYISNSSNNALVSTQFGATGDLIAPADFDGDGKTDINVFRPADGTWYRLNSSNNTFSPNQFGTNGDLPTPGDFGGDGRADLTVYRPSSGNWFRINSSNNQFVAVQFGVAEDKPLVGDFDGDGRSDLTVFRPSNGTWYRINSATDTFSLNQFGAPGDKPVPADYDGDGKTDLAVYRPSVGDWYVINSLTGAFTATHFGLTEDKPAPADFDGDGRADLVVFRPSSGTWYLLRTTAGFTGFQFGTQGDIPAPHAFVR
jgi:uncharacterized delta-60 repeat protein